MTSTERDAAFAGALTWSAVAEVTEALRLPPDGLVLDIACGRGGYGIEVARRTGARLVGVDFSAVALAQARSISAGRLPEGRSVVASPSRVGRPLIRPTGGSRRATPTRRCGRYRLRAGARWSRSTRCAGCSPPQPHPEADGARPVSLRSAVSLRNAATPRPAAGRAVRPRR